MGFKWLLPGPRSSSASAQYPQGYCCGQTDRRTAVLPVQTGVFSLTLRSAEAPRMLGFPSLALQEHPAGASLSVAMEMRLRRSPGAVPLRGSCRTPPAPPQLFPLAAPGDH